MLHRRPLARLLGLAFSIALLAIVSPMPAWSQVPAAAQVPPPAQLPDQGDIYTVRDVEVDVTADNSAVARDKAINEAQRKAFNTLYGRLSPEPGAKAPDLSDLDIARMVQDFDVQRERSSAVRYLATLTVRFRPANVRSLLQTKGSSYVEVRSKPVLVLPIFQSTGSPPLLWEDRTAWRSAWENYPPPQGMVPVVVPYGELADIADVSASKALEGDPSGFTAIAKRYDAGDVLVAVLGVRGAEPDPSSPNTVKLTRYSPDGTKRSDTVTVPAAPGQSVDAYLTGGVAAVVRSLEDSWRRANTVAAGPEHIIQVSVPISRLDDWVQTRRRLSQVPTVSRVDLLNLSRSSAKLEMHYRGEQEVLRTALAQQDLSLTEAPPLDPAAMQGAAPVSMPFSGQTLPGAPVTVIGPDGRPVGVMQAGPVWELRWSGSRAGSSGSFSRTAP